MPTNKPSFTQRELARALKAIRDAGMKATSVSVDHKAGRVSVWLDDGSTVEAASADEAEAWIRKHHAHKR